jgi:hypothetical protein
VPVALVTSRSPSFRCADCSAESGSAHLRFLALMMTGVRGPAVNEL